jgi:signal transduction histidine kinase
VTTTSNVQARAVTAEVRPGTAATVPLPTGRRRRRWGHLGLRTRLTLTFALGALGLSAVLSVVTFGLTRENLLSQREDSAVSQAISNAERLNNRLDAELDASDTQQVLTALPTPEGALPVMLYGGEWYASDPGEFGRDDIPVELRETVGAGEAARMRISYQGSPYLVVGIPVPQLEAQYFEGVSLMDLRDTLEGLAISLLGAATITTVAGGLLGFWASRRVFTPLLDVGVAAEAIAGGRLDTRLPTGNDPDLDLIAVPFNEMAGALEDRLERDARFASEVSHELRSPLMTLAATVEVLENSHDELPERAQTALVLLSADVDRLQQLVEDLLEISRFDVGAIKLHLEEVVAVEMVIQAVSVLAGGGVPVRYEPEVGDAIVRVDKRRFGQVIANLLDNAEKYAGGATSVNLSTEDGRLLIAVEDRGPGVAPEDRPIIFGRFSRGSGSGNRSTDSGVGLGLALVDEHVRLHGGRVWVEDRVDGQPGARFVVELPLIEPIPTVDDKETG